MGRTAIYRDGTTVNIRMEKDLYKAVRKKAKQLKTKGGFSGFTVRLYKQALRLKCRSLNKETQTFTEAEAARYGV